MRADPALPNLDFLTISSKEPQRIQQKHYKEFIKNGNLKRLMHLETAKESDNTERDLFENESLRESASNEPLHKGVKRPTN